MVDSQEPEDEAYKLPKKAKKVSSSKNPRKELDWAKSQRTRFRTSFFQFGFDFQWKKYKKIAKLDSKTPHEIQSFAECLVQVVFGAWKDDSAPNAYIQAVEDT